MQVRVFSCQLHPAVVCLCALYPEAAPTVPCPNFMGASACQDSRIYGWQCQCILRIEFFRQISSWLDQTAGHSATRIGPPNTKRSEARISSWSTSPTSRHVYPNHAALHSSWRAHELRVLTHKPKENDGEHARSIHSSYFHLLHLFIAQLEASKELTIITGIEESEKEKKKRKKKTETDCKNWCALSSRRWTLQSQKG